MATAATDGSAEISNGGPTLSPRHSPRPAKRASDRLHESTRPIGKTGESARDQVPRVNAAADGEVASVRQGNGSRARAEQHLEDRGLVIEAPLVPVVLRVASGGDTSASAPRSNAYNRVGYRFHLAKQRHQPSEGLLPVVRNDSTRVRKRCIASTTSPFRRARVAPHRKPQTRPPQEAVLPRGSSGCVPR